MRRDEQKGWSWLRGLSEKLLSKEKSGWSYKYVLILGSLGMILMLLSHFISPSQTANEEQEEPFPTLASEEEPVFKAKNTEVQERSSTGMMEDYEIYYENQLRDVLEEITGITDVSIMINLAETERNIYEKNTRMTQQTTDEVDREGGTRKVEDLVRDEELIIVRSGEKEEPILVRKEKPDIKGVLVVARGVENAQLKGWVVEAVSRVLDVPSHRVSVMPKKIRED